MTERRTYFDLARPVLAAVGFSDDEAARFEPLVGSVVAASGFESLARPWDEIDVAVANSSVDDHVPAVVPVLYRATKEDAAIDYRVLSLPDTHRLWESDTSTVVMAAETMDSARLNQAIAETVTTYPAGNRRIFGAVGDSEWIRRFITNQRGETLSGEYRRSGSGLAWVLPPHASVTPDWLRLFLQRINEDDSERVPAPPPDWEPWDSASVEKVKSERRAVYDEASEAMSGYSDALARFDAEIAAQVEESNTNGHGLLLSADGDVLKDAVNRGLEILGFDTTDVDATLAEGEGKREDLWVEYRDELCLCEVKGYTSGARLRDLMRAMDYRLLYLEKHGTSSHTQWHVVNANRTADPSARQVLFEGHDDAVDGFGGLIIDTRDLFRLVRDVERGTISDQAARDLLWDADPGRFSHRTD